MIKPKEHDEKFNQIIQELRALRKDISDIKTYIERTLLALQEEARGIIQHKLKKAGIPIKLKPLITPHLEISIYGATEDTCIIGEVSTRTGTRIINALNKKIDELQRKHPEYLRPKIIKAIYTLWATDEAIEKAAQEGIWLIKATGELTPLKIINSTKK